MLTYFAVVFLVTVLLQKQHFTTFHTFHVNFAIIKATRECCRFVNVGSQDLESWRPFCSSLVLVWNLSVHPTLNMVPLVLPTTFLPNRGVSPMRQRESKMLAWGPGALHLCPTWRIFNFLSPPMCQRETEDNLPIAYLLSIKNASLHKSPRKLMRFSSDTRGQVNQSSSNLWIFNGCWKVNLVLGGLRHVSRN